MVPGPTFMGDAQVDAMTDVAATDVTDLPD